VKSVVTHISGNLPGITQGTPAVLIRKKKKKKKDKEVGGKKEKRISKDIPIRKEDPNFS